MSFAVFEIRLLGFTPLDRKPPPVWRVLAKGLPGSDATLNLDLLLLPKLADLDPTVTTWLVATPNVRERRRTNKGDPADGLQLVARRALMHYRIRDAECPESCPSIDPPIGHAPDDSESRIDSGTGGSVGLDNPAGERKADPQPPWYELANRGLEV